MEKTRQDNNKLGTVDNFIDKFGKHKIIFVVAMINVNSTASGREDFRGGFRGLWAKNSWGWALGN